VQGAPAEESIDRMLCLAWDSSESASTRGSEKAAQMPRPPAMPATALTSICWSVSASAPSSTSSSLLSSIADAAPPASVLRDTGAKDQISLCHTNSSSCQSCQLRPMTRALPLLLGLHE
jgi:hypothetical protein